MLRRKNFISGNLYQQSMTGSSAPPPIAIDNAFVGPGLTVTQRRVGPDNGSDHRPIVVTVARTR